MELGSLELAAGLPAIIYNARSADVLICTWFNSRARHISRPLGGFFYDPDYVAASPYFKLNSHKSRVLPGISPCRLEKQD